MENVPALERLAGHVGVGGAALSGFFLAIAAIDLDSDRAEDGVGNADQEQDAAGEAGGHALSLRRILQSGSAHGALRLCRTLKQANRKNTQQRDGSEPAVHDYLWSSALPSGALPSAPASALWPVGITNEGDTFSRACVGSFVVSPKVNANRIIARISGENVS